MLKRILALSLIFSSAEAGKTSSQYYSQGKLTRAILAIRRELSNAKEEDIERLLDLALNILSQSKSDEHKFILKIFRATQKKNLSPYLAQRISNDIKVLETWGAIKKLSVNELRKKISDAEKMNEPRLTPNLHKRSLLRIFFHAVKWRNFKKKDPRWMLAQVKAEYALNKGGLNTLKELGRIENLPKDIRADVERMLEELE